MIRHLTALALALAAAPAGAADTDDAAITLAMGQPFYTGQILPTPQHADYGDGAALLVNGPAGRSRVQIVVAGEGPAHPLAERLIRQRLDAYAAAFDAAFDFDADSADAPRHTLLLATRGEPAAASLLNRLGLEDQVSSLPPQGYLLAVEDDATLLLGADGPGLVNAAASLIQLLHVRDGRLVARHARIHDAPAFTQRYVVEYRVPDAAFFDWMMRYKFNGFAIGWPYFDWRGVTEAQQRDLAGLRNYIASYGTLRFMASVHIGGRAGRFPRPDYGNPEHMAQIVATVDHIVTASGASHVMLLHDDADPHLTEPMEQKKYADLAEAHGEVLTRVLAMLQAKHPDVTLSFCPPFYQGRRNRKWRPDSPVLDEMKTYLRATQDWPEAVRLVWTGPQTESKTLSREDLAHYRGFIGDERPLIYWDNTWHYHQPLRNFHARYPEQFVELCADRLAFLHINATRPIGQFFAATAVDYYWNPDAFDSVRARREAVTQFMGPHAVAPAERLYSLRGDDYFAFFAPAVDLAQLRAVLEDLEAAAWTSDIPAYCKRVLKEIQDMRAN